MDKNIDKQLKETAKLKGAELREKYAQIVGRDTNVTSRQRLLDGIARVLIHDAEMAKAEEKKNGKPPKGKKVQPIKAPLVEFDYDPEAGLPGIEEVLIESPDESKDLPAAAVEAATGGTTAPVISEGEPDRVVSAAEPTLEALTDEPAENPKVSPPPAASEAVDGLSIAAADDVTAAVDDPVASLDGDVAAAKLDEPVAATSQNSPPETNDAKPTKRTRLSARKPGQRDPRLPLAGAWIEREYKGKQVRVMVLQDGFLYNGNQYRSLSALAKELTGTNNNGLRFFGLIDRPSTKATTRSEQ
jgi:hypothetical protein